MHPGMRHSEVDGQTDKQAHLQGETDQSKHEPRLQQENLSMLRELAGCGVSRGWMGQQHLLGFGAHSKAPLLITSPSAGAQVPLSLPGKGTTSPKGLCWCQWGQPGSGECSLSLGKKIIVGGQPIL